MSTLLSGILSRNLSVTVASGDLFDIRRFTIAQKISSLFSIELEVVSDDAAIDFDGILGQPATFTMYAGSVERSWSGVCARVELARVEEDGLSTYALTVAPTLWLLTQRRNYRIFQHMAEPDIVARLLREWQIEPIFRLGRTYRAREYRVQYGESDYTFISRMVEDAGISFCFEQAGAETKLVLTDAPHRNQLRAPALPFKDDVSMVRGEYATHQRVVKVVRPGRYTMRDRDPRLPASYPLVASAEDRGALGVETRLERFHYVPGAFLADSTKGDGTPVADDRGKIRSDEAEAAVLAERRLLAKRANAKVLTFETNAHDLAPGVVVSFDEHPHPELAPGKPWLIVESKLSGAHDGDWSHLCEARSADAPYHPPLAAPKPRVMGVESATVVGPPGEEIHCDEFGRVRVHFHWDRESRMDDGSSCWIPVCHPWGGAGFGAMNLPRVGQEVVVDFFGGDPDRPVIIGRTYTATQPVPYSLPESKTQSGWRSQSSPGGGGYNEILFEDLKGAEVFGMQAERDMRKIVKRNLEVTVGKDRIETVENNEDVMINNNRSTTVQSNERHFVGLSRAEVVGLNHAVDVGANQRLNITGEQSEMVGAGKALSVGASYDVTVGGAMSVTVNGAKTVIAGETLALNCGAASIVLEKSGKITLVGTEIAVQSSGPVSISGTTVSVGGEQVDVSASGPIAIGGASVHLSGDPVDMNS